MDGLLEVVRVVGVLVGLWGVVVTAPAAAHDLVAAPVRAAKAMRARLRKPGPALAGVVGVVTSSLGSLTVEGYGEFWDDAATVEAKIERLREQMVARTDRLARADREQNEAIASLAQRVNDENAALRADVDRVRAELEREQDLSRRLNARGVPLVGVAVVLSGLPDSWASSPWVAWPLVALTLALGARTALLIRRDAKDRQSAST